MSPSKNTGKDEDAAVELSKTVRLAVHALGRAGQVLDGRQFSDEELDVLCDIALSSPVGSRVRDVATRASA